MPEFTFEQYAAVRRHVGLAFSPDGQHVAYTNNVSGQFNIWRQPVHLGSDGTIPAPRQLTALEEDVARTVAWSPDGAEILTTADHQGNENFQLARVPADHGWLYPITRETTSRNEVPEHPYSPDGARLLYGSNQRNPFDFDALVRDVKTGESQTILAGDANYFPVSWSPDGESVLVVQLHGNTNTDVFLCHMASGESRNLTGHEGDTIYSPGPWRKDGKSFLLLTNQGREFLGLASLEVDTGELTWIETPDWDVETVELSSDGRYMAWTVNEDGYSRLYVRDLQSGSTRTFSDLPAGVYTSVSFSPTEPLLGLYIAREALPRICTCSTSKATFTTASRTVSWAECRNRRWFNRN